MEIVTAHQWRLLSRARRRELQLSQQRLADRANVSRKWISGFELGKGEVELSPVLRVMAALQLRVDLAPDHHHHTGTSPLREANDLEMILNRLSKPGSTDD